jgi:ketosteroid isomerase-like protein
VDTVARMFDAYNERDVERILALTHPDCELVPFRAQLEGTSYRGHEGVRRFVRDMEDDWQALMIEPAEMVAHGDVVVVTGQVKGTGRTSGVAIDFVAGVVVELRDELVFRIRSYNDPDEARRAAGTQPE